MRVGELFDRTGAITRPPLRRLGREAWSLVAYRPASPDPAALPPGRGHVVLVIPAFLTTDLVTLPLRRFLTRCGYRAEGWELGLNIGPTPRALAGLQRRLAALRERESGPIGLVGVSLGGLMARQLTLDHPGHVRHLVTLVAPVRLPTATPLEPLFRLFARVYAPSIEATHLRQPLAVPSTMIYTRDDGMVAWETCIGPEPLGAAFEVRGAHITICRNPEVLRIVAERLSTD